MASPVLLSVDSNSECFCGKKNPITSTLRPHVAFYTMLLTKLTPPLILHHIAFCTQLYVQPQRFSRLNHVPDIFGRGTGVSLFFLLTLQSCFFLTLLHNSLPNKGRHCKENSGKRKGDANGQMLLVQSTAEKILCKNSKNF